MQIQRVWFDAGIAMGFKHRGDIPLQDRSVIEQSATDLVAFGQESSINRFVRSHPLP
ncbi:hypothetical protein D3C76_1659230 [compost metagenome]